MFELVKVTEVSAEFSMANTSSSSSPVCQKKKKKQLQQQHQQLIPGLPEPVAQICLALVGDPCLLFSVCHSWRRLLYSPSFPPFLSLYAFLSSSTPTSLSSQSTRLATSTSLQIFTFDPISSTWHPLPPPPPDLPLQLLLRRHPSFLSRNLPIQSISVTGKLILLAASTHNLHPALSRPLIFDPISQNWSFGPTLTTPRRWCALGASSGSVYVASGIGTKFSCQVARSMEKWDFTRNPNNGEWEKKRDLKHGRFSRDAIDAVGWRGKLCMVNVKGEAAAKEGIVYDVERDTWQEMPKGMLHGWRGPVGAMAETVMYGVDEANGTLRKYNEEKDTWEEIMESEGLRGAEQVVAEGGRVCIVSGGGISAVDVTATPARIWEVELPVGLEAVAVHVLPRMPAPHSPLND